MSNINESGSGCEREPGENIRTSGPSLVQRYPRGIASASAELVTPEHAAAFIAENAHRFPGLGLLGGEVQL